MNQTIKEQIGQWDNLFQKESDFYHRAAQWAGLSDASYWVLYFLCDSDGIVTQSFLCQKKYFSKQTINSAVTKLGKMGLIKLENQKGQGNRKSIDLTVAGNEFCDKYVRSIIDVTIKAFGSLTEEERTMMLTLVGKLLNNMEEEADRVWK